MGKSPSLFTREEFTKQVLPNAVRQCRIELLRKGVLGKKGTRVDRNALMQCVRQKIAEEKRARLAKIAGYG